MRRLLLATALVVALAPALASAQDHDHAEIPVLLHQIADAWNDGDLPGHVAVYADSATFMTGRGPIVGRHRTAEALERSFFRDGRPLQQLRFEQIQVRPLGPDHALVIGRFILHGGGMDESSGWFSTIWAWTGARWETIHDHSS
jgi:uncharacterized protein (TIGR02246 family)